MANKSRFASGGVLEAFDDTVGTATAIGTIKVNGTTYTKYRKIIDFGNLPNADAKSVAHGISNINRILSMYGVCQASNTYTSIPTGHPTSLTNAIAIFADNTYVTVRTGNDKSGQTAFITIEYY